MKLHYTELAEVDKVISFCERIECMGNTLSFKFTPMTPPTTLQVMYSSSDDSYNGKDQFSDLFIDLFIDEFN